MQIPKTEEEWIEQLKDAFYSGVRVGEMSEAGLEGKTDFNYWFKWKKLLDEKRDQSPNINRGA